MAQPLYRQLSHSEICESAAYRRRGVSVLSSGWIVGPGENSQLTLVARVLAVQEVQETAANGLIKITPGCFDRKKIGILDKFGARIATDIGKSAVAGIRMSENRQPIAFLDDVHDIRNALRGQTLFTGFLDIQLSQHSLKVSLALGRVKDTDDMNRTLFRSVAGNLEAREYRELVTLGDFLYFIDRRDNVVVGDGNPIKTSLLGALYNLLQRQILILKIMRRGGMYMEIQSPQAESLALFQLLFFTTHLP